MLFDKGINEILTASEAVKQVRNSISLAIPGADVDTRLVSTGCKNRLYVRFNDSTVLQHRNNLSGVIKLLRSFVGYASDCPLQLWHRQLGGTFRHYQLHSIRYYLDLEWREITVSVNGKDAGWQYWRLTHDDFETRLRPFLNKWTEKNIQIIYSIIVGNRTQSEAALEFGKTKQNVHNILLRAYNIYIRALKQNLKILHDSSYPADGVSQNTQRPTSEEES